MNPLDHVSVKHLHCYHVTGKYVRDFQKARLNAGMQRCIGISHPFSKWDKVYVPTQKFKYQLPMVTEKTQIASFPAISVKV